MITRLAIVGIGVIGGSLAKRAIEEGYVVSVYDVDASTRELARMAGICVSDSAVEVVANADIIVLATFVDDLPSVACVIAGAVRPGAVVTDVGSVKAGASQTIALALSGGGVEYVPSHPMAGKAFSGFGYSNSEMFEGCTWVICPIGHNAESIARVERLAVDVGAGRIVYRSPGVHDLQVAAISHLPQLLVTGVAAILADARTTAGLDLRDDVTHKCFRIASFSHHMWMPIVAANRQRILRCLRYAMEPTENLRNLHALRDFDTATSVIRQAIETCKSAGSVVVDGHSGGSGIPAALGFALANAAVATELVEPGTIELAGPGFRTSTTGLVSDVDALGDADGALRSLDLVGEVLRRLQLMLETDDGAGLQSLFFDANRFHALVAATE